MTIETFPCTRGDEHWLSDEELTKNVSTEEFDTFSLSSTYVKMPDGVHLAVDIFLPKHSTSTTGDNDNEQQRSFPTVLHLTRYNRNWEFAPCSAIACSLLTGGCLCGKLSNGMFKMDGGLPGTRGSHWNMRSVKYTQEFLPAGFAWATVDVRGTGASEGTRPIDLHETEVLDTKFLMEWVVQQPWCEQNRLYSTGISYDGMSSLAMASHNTSSLTNASVNAIAPLFAPFDLMDELSHPGGLRCIGFTKEYGKFVHHLERNTPTGFPPVQDLIIQLLGTRVRHVDRDTNEGRAFHENAIAQHADNWDMLQTQRLIMNRDDPGGPVQSIDEISVHTRIQAIAENDNTDHLSVSGWYDSGTALGAVRYYMTVLKYYNNKSMDMKKKLRKPQLLLGPWNHGARNNSSPFAKTDTPSFPLVTELLRFFSGSNADDDGTGSSPFLPVHYFTVGEEAWKGCHTWPPPHRNMRMDICQGKSLAFVDKKKNDNDSPARSMHEEVAQPELVLSNSAESTTWNVDTASTTGRVSRWNLVQHIFKKAITYPDRKEQDKHNLVIDASDPLDESFEVTGHPSVTLYLQVDVEDAGLFVYLEEVFPDGRVVYVTEGQLRLAHRKIGVTPSPFYDDSCVPYRSFLKKDCKLLKKNEGPVRAIIPFFPISYMFSAGSKIRLSIAMYDTDNFDPLSNNGAEKQPTKLTVFHKASYLNLTHVVAPSK